MRRAFLLFALLLMPGCSTTYQPQYCQGPAILATGSASEIRATAVADARADIAADRPRVAFTGGFFCQAVGVPDEDLDLIKHLPNVPLPCGCTADFLEQAAVYAEAYNRGILPSLLAKKETDKN